MSLEREQLRLMCQEKWQAGVQIGSRSYFCNNETVLSLFADLEAAEKALAEGDALMVRLCRALGMTNGEDRLALDLRVATSDWQQRRPQP